jgi:phage protein D
MAGREQTSRFAIQVDGAPLPVALERTMVSAFVDDSLNLPDMFQLTFRDPKRTAITDGGFTMGATVTVKVFSEATRGGELLISGEVTALEAEFDVDGTMTVIRGFDPSHRLFRGRTTETYTDVTYSDVATKVARRAGLKVGKVDSASTVHKHVSQGNLTDWQFLRGLAAEIGYEVGCFDGKFEFRKPTKSSDGPQSGDLASEDPLQLVMGKSLLRFRSTITSAEQVKEVTVRGWDMRQKKALIGTAPAETDAATVGLDPAGLAKKFGDPTFVGVNRPYGTQAEVDGAAKAIAGEIAGTLAEFEGVACGNQALRAGKAVSLGLVAEPFDGRYTLTTTRHVYNPRDGYTVWFTVSGPQDRTLLSLSSANGSGGPAINGVAAGLVTDVKDPEDLGRVKLKFPWLSDSYTTDWARLVQLGAGKDRGSVMLPEVNDEVLVAFEQGDIRRPYVIGGLFNGVDKPKLGDGLIDGSTGAVKRRGFISKKGHKLVFLDDASKSGVMVATGDGGMRIALKETGTTIKVTSKGAVEIEAGSKVTITAKSNVEIKADGQMKLEAGAGLTLDGGPTVEVKGQVIKLN